jgi:hypothetical protein
MYSLDDPVTRWRRLTSAESSQAFSFVRGGDADVAIRRQYLEVSHVPASSQSSRNHAGDLGAVVDARHATSFDPRKRTTR